MTLLSATPVIANAESTDVAAIKTIVESVAVLADSARE